MSDYPPYFPLYVDDYLSETMHLMPAESDALMKLKAIAWKSESCSIPDNDEWIRSRLGITRPTWKRIRPNVLALWYKTDSGDWVHKKLQKFHQKAVEISKKNREAANKRWESNDGNALKNLKATHASALQTQSKRNASITIPKPISINNNISDDGFEGFWNAYPRRGSIEKSKDEWGQSITKETPERIQAATRKYLEITDPKFVVNSDRFLRDEKWRDYLDDQELIFPEWLKIIRNHKLGSYECALFMKDCRFERIGDKSATIYCPNDFIRQRIENNHEQTVRQAHGLEDIKIIVVG